MRRIRGCIIPRVRMGNLNLAWLGLGWQIEPEVLSLFWRDALDSA